RSPRSPRCPYTTLFRSLFGLTPFALEEAAGNAATGVELFLIVHREREEILPFARRLGTDRGNQNDSVVDPDDDGTAGLASDFARLQCDLMIAVLECLGYFRHVIVSWVRVTKALRTERTCFM